MGQILDDPPPPTRDDRLDHFLTTAMARIPLTDTQQRHSSSPICEGSPLGTRAPPAPDLHDRGAAVSPARVPATRAVQCRDDTRPLGSAPRGTDPARRDGQGHLGTRSGRPRSGSRHRRQRRHIGSESGLASSKSESFASDPYSGRKIVVLPLAMPERTPLLQVLVVSRSRQRRSPLTHHHENRLLGMVGLVRPRPTVRRCQPRPRIGRRPTRHERFEAV